MQPRGRRPVDLQIHFQAFVLLVGIDVFQLRHILQRLGDLRHPLVQIVQRVRLDCVLIAAIALASAGAHAGGAGRRQEQARPCNIGELRPHAVDHFLGRLVAALGGRLEGDKDIAGIRGAIAAGKTAHRLHCRIGADNVHELDEFLLHQLERDALVTPDAALHAAFIDIREEALGHDRQQIDIQAHRHQQDEHDGLGVIQRPVQGAAVKNHGPGQRGNATCAASGFHAPAG